MKMTFPQKAFLLFLLNLLDALLTIFWVRNGFASEGNHLMAGLLDLGDTPFLLVKITIGGLTAFVLWRWNQSPIAKFGLFIALAVYIGLMAIHFVTGLSAIGFLSQTQINDFSIWANNLFA